MLRLIAFTLLAVVGLSFGPSTPQISEEDYKASMEGWMVKIENAHKKSIAEGKPILANFTGTDWCGWCIRLRKEVFDTKKFKDWANENVVLLELDFPRRFKLPESIQQQTTFN